MPSSAQEFVPRVVEDVYTDTATVSVHDHRQHNPGWPVRVSLAVLEGDADDHEPATLHLAPEAARALAAHLIQAAQAVEAAQ